MRKRKREQLVKKIEALEAEALRGLEKNCSLEGKRFILLEDFHRRMPDWDLVILKNVLVELVVKGIVTRRDSVYVSGRVMRFGLRNLI